MTTNGWISATEGMTQEGEAAAEGQGQGTKTLEVCSTL